MFYNVINNINIDKLPELVQQTILEEFNKLSIQNKLIIYSKLIHGNLFKIEKKDLFKLNKISITKTYEQFIESLKYNLVA